MALPSVFLFAVPWLGLGRQRGISYCKRKEKLSFASAEEECVDVDALLPEGGRRLFLSSLTPRGRGALRAQPLPDEGCLYAGSSPAVANCERRRYGS